MDQLQPAAERVRKLTRTVAQEVVEIAVPLEAVVLDVDILDQMGRVQGTDSQAPLGLSQLGQCPRCFCDVADDDDGA